MFIFRGNSRTLRWSAVLLTGSKMGFVCKFSYFCSSSTSSMFFFRGNSRTFRCSAMLLNGIFTIKLVLFWRFWRCNIRPKNWSRVFVLIFVFFGVPQHPAQELMFIFHLIFVLFGVLHHLAQELMFIFPGNFRTCRCSCSHITHRVPTHGAHT